MQELAETLSHAETPGAYAPGADSLVVLTRDPELAQTLQGLGNSHAVVFVDAEADLANELVGRHAGVAIIDTAAVVNPVERLTQKLKAQLPDLVLIVAGRLDDQGALAAQITNGTVYRFLHKPTSEQRVKLFVDAAWRRRSEASSEAVATQVSAGGPSRPVPGGTRSTVLLGALAVAGVIALAGWFIGRGSSSSQVATPATAARSPGNLSQDEKLEALLARADAALAAGVLIGPPAENAADLYSAALRRGDSDPRAAAGIEKVIDKLLTAAEQQLADQHFNEAQRLTDQARAIKADHVRVAFLTAQLGKAREHLAQTRVRQAAAARADVTNAPAEQPASGSAAPAATAGANPAPVAASAAVAPSVAPVPAPAIQQQPETEATKVEPRPVAPAPASNNSADVVLATVKSDAPTPAPELVSAGSLQLVHQSLPTFPSKAREQGVSGWVELQFLVRTDGTVSDVSITAAQPVGLFEQAAMDAVRKWRYKPVQRDGQAVTQRARLRLKFALEK